MMTRFAAAWWADRTRLIGPGESLEGLRPGLPDHHPGDELYILAPFLPVSAAVEPHLRASVHTERVVCVRHKHAQQRAIPC